MADSNNNGSTDTQRRIDDLQARANTATGVEKERIEAEIDRLKAAGHDTMAEGKKFIGDTAQKARDVGRNLEDDLGLS